MLYLRHKIIHINVKLVEQKIQMAAYEFMFFFLYIIGKIYTFIFIILTDELIHLPHIIQTWN